MNEAIAAKKKTLLLLNHAMSSHDIKINRLLQMRNFVKMSGKCQEIYVLLESLEKLLSLWWYHTKIFSAWSYISY